MAKQFDCECYLRALEEQADNIGGAATSMLEAINTFKNSAVLAADSRESEVHDQYDKKCYEFSSWRTGCREDEHQEGGVVTNCVRRGLG